MEREVKLLEIYYTIRPILESENILVSDYKIINYGLQFFVSIFKWKGVIRLFLNKKNVLKIDYSQLKSGKNREKIIALIEKNRASFDPQKAEIDREFHLGYPVIGTDESGKGDYFGPLVSAAIYLDEKSADKLLGHDVKDSKALSDERILQLGKKIEPICRWRFVILEISPQRYNELYEKFQQENKNLNHLLAWAHAKAIEQLLSKIECDIAIVDQFANKRFMLDKLQQKGKKLKLVQKHKGEKNLAVAAASILARARFLDKMKKLSEEYEINFPKGASQKVIEAGEEFVEKHGEEELSKVAKLHFRTTERILSE